MIKKILLATALLPSLAFADTNRIDYLNFSSQAEFNNFSKDLTGALGYKTLSPAEPLGIAGFDIGVSYDQSSLKYKLMDKVSANGKADLSMLTLHLAKGLPLGIDVGVDYSSFPLSNISVLGGSVSYAILDGGIAMPAIGIKANYNKTQGLKALDYSSYGAELGISKGIANITPYASVGMVSSEITPDNGYNINTSVSKTTQTLSKYAVGVNFNLFIMDMNVAYNQIGDVATYSLKAGYRF